MLDELIVAAFGFARTIVGMVNHPYETYRRVVIRANPWELVYLAAVSAAYFALASVVKTASFRPFLLTRQFVVLTTGALISFTVSLTALWLLARLLGGQGKLRALAVAWAYTLVPTLTWFLATSVLYVVIPPPRTTGPLGIIFSIVYLVFSATLFYWKATLAYLTLRFGMRLDLPRIVGVFLAAAPVFIFYSLAMYRLGIFKIPFL